MDMQKKLSVGDATKLLGIKRQSVCAAIKKGRLKAERDFDNKWVMTIEELERYEASKYKRMESALLNKQKVYGDNRITVRAAAELLGCDVQVVYFMVYSGRIKSVYVGAYLVVFRDEIEKIAKDREALTHLYVI